MNDALQIALVSAVLNGAVTWGVVSTKLAWLRRDVDLLYERMRSAEGELRSANLASKVMTEFDHR